MTDAAREVVARAICENIMRDLLQNRPHPASEEVVNTHVTEAWTRYLTLADAAIAAYEAAQWRPIEEAPTDGTFFLACCGKWRPFVAHFYRGTVVSDQGEDGLIAYPATHFCPIPPPPENEG